MASNSALSVQKSFKYDVFLSFRGEVTRRGFVDHLYHALHHKGVTTYKDDERIEKGERISEQLIRSIQDSRFYIIVFSKNYASSSWCLDELVKIMECQRTTEQTAYPIFYDVEPTEVRNQSGPVGEAFAKHVEKESAGRWRDALKEAAGLAGWELKNTFDGHEAKFIGKIVIDISIKLHFINLSVDEKLVGMETRVKSVVSSLEIDSDDFRMIGIKGMGGGGKTTLARAVFDNISIWFEGKCFVEDVREVSKGYYGLRKLQEHILSVVSDDQSIVVTSVFDGKRMMKKMMSGRKVLVVLDDVDDIDQLEALAGEPNWFESGSRIIITTRDEQVLVAHGVHSDYIHDVNLLSHHEAVCLFSKYAFKREVPIQGYEELSGRVVHYAAGLPLTIKVLGSFLHCKTEREWVDALDRLKSIPLKQTLDKLEISYNGLENDQKEIFLDVACILKGEEKNKAIRILESCGYHAEIGLRVLEQKSLITISHHGVLRLHDHIEEMGRNIVRRLHPDEPKQHNRLWVKEEIEDILINDLGTEATRSIKLENTDLHPSIIMNGLIKMKELRFFHVCSGFREWKIDDVSQYLPNALRSLHWGGYPYRCLPKTFQADKLLNLEMYYVCSIFELWEGGERKGLNKLRFLNINYSKLRTFDLGMTPNLETLDLGYSCDLVELNMLVECPKLKSINLSGSKVTNLNLGMTPSLEKLLLEGCNAFVGLNIPVECSKLEYLNLSGSKVTNHNLGMTPSLKMLHLEGCNDFAELHIPVECSKLKSLNLSGSKVTNLSLGMTPSLENLHLEGCNDFVELHMPVKCPKLKFLNLGGSKVSNFNLGMTPNLEMLDLRRCSDFLELHIPTECLMLKCLYLCGCKVTNLNLMMIPNLSEVDLRGCNDFVELNMIIECPKLEILDLSGSKVRNFNLGLTPNLRKLDLGGCNDFVELHTPMECQYLKFLNLRCSKLRNLNLGMTANLDFLDLNECYYLQEIYAPVGCLKDLLYLNLSGCLRFERFFLSKRHELLGLDCLATLQLIAESIDLCPLHPNNNLPKFQFRCFYDEPLYSSSGNLEKLISFGICACTQLESFSASICSLQRLGKLTLEGRIPEVPKDLYLLDSLEELTLSIQDIKHLPDSICMLKHLKYLKLNNCWLLEQLPKDLGRLQCLEELHLMDCISLQGIPNSVCTLKYLRYLLLPYCILVEKLPEELGLLECMMVLNIEGAGISRLPQSLFQLKGLLIIGSRWRLESYGITSLIEFSKYTASFYVS